jgi:hypothetical protein
MGLNAKTAREALAFLNRGKPQAWVARKFGVSTASISYLANGVTWKHLDRPAGPRNSAEALFSRLNPSTSDWLARAIEAVRSVAEVVQDFTTEDVWAEIELPAGLDPRLIGEAMKLAHKESICEPTDRFRQPRSPELKRSYQGRPLRVWRSLVL